MATFSRSDSARATNASVGGNGLVLGVYTSSQVQKFGGAIPAGIVQVNAGAASRLGNQKAFFIDTRVRAFIPFEEAFFPQFRERSRGLVGKADAALRTQVVKMYGEINQRRPEQIVNVGPYRPR